MKKLLLCSIMLFNCQQQPQSKLLDQTSRFLGTNYWFGMNLGMERGGDRERLMRELDTLQSLGLTNLRIMASSEGPSTEPYRIVPPLQPSPGVYSEDVFVGLDFLLSEMDKRELKAVLCLNNFWHWSGGFAQYVSWAEGSAIPYPPQQASYAVFEDYSSRFYSSDLARKWYADFLKTITGRVNTVTGVPYRRDPTIFSWELANEPRGISHYDDFINWVGESSKYLRGNVEQWVTVGSEGVTPFQPEKDVEEAHAFDAVDYMTYHIWVQNWGVYNPNSDSVNDAIDFARKYTEKNLKIGNKLGKPIILEEFGLARDGGAFDPKSGTSARDTYFATMLKELDTLVGISFWAFAGEGKPKNTGGIWDVGDPFTGDPPHEPQGWYSVYSTDHSTLEIFKRAK